ncbi:MAG TPA: right-handed parallel beta-helix repeat-containing protein [Pyrinomonadaceae bacterium]|jgi:hypothetical protein
MKKLFLLFVLLLVSSSVRAQQTVFVPNCSGSNDTAVFSAIIASIGSNTGTIKLPFKRGSRCAVDTLTIPSNITLDNTDGTGIQVNTSLTLARIANPPSKQIFYMGVGATLSFSVSPREVYPEWFGAQHDGVRLSDAAISATSTIMTSATSCAPTDVGKAINVKGAGAADLVTTIASCSGSNFVLTLAASTTVSGAKAFYATPDTAAINYAKNSIPTNGQSSTLYFSPGIWHTTGGIEMSRDNLTIKGAGMGATIIAGTTSASSVFQRPAGGSNFNIAFEDIGFDNSFATFTSTISTNRSLMGGTFRVSRCAFWKPGGGGAVGLNGMSNVTIENNLFQTDGIPGSSVGIIMQNANSNITIRGNTFRYLTDAVVGDSNGTEGGPYADLIENINIENNTFNAGWWTLKEKYTGSTGTYTGTVLTDSAAAFSAISASDTVRIMPVKVTSGATVTYDRLKITDTSVNFNSTSNPMGRAVERGDIIRAGSAFAVVSSVDSNTVLRVEDWLSDTDRLPVARPATNTAFTIYGLWLGSVSSSTGTTVSVDRWRDFDGNSATPPSGTRYEVLYSHPNYPINLEASTRLVRISGNTLRRGWSDQISVYGEQYRITDNTIEDSQDSSITVHGARGLISGNRISHSGTYGIFSQGVDNVITENIITDSQWTNNLDAVKLGDIIVRGSSSRTVVSLNNCRRINLLPYGYHGIVVWNTSTTTLTDDVRVVGNTSTGHVTDDIRVYGAGVTNTLVENNRADVYDLAVTAISSARSQRLSGTATYDAPSLTNGSSTTTTITVPGASAGDPSAVSLDTATASGWDISGIVTARDTVTVTIVNRTGGTADLASGTLKAFVWPITRQRTDRLSSTTTYDPPSLANGASTSTTVTVTGAVVGDAAHADHSSIAVSGWTVRAYVVSPDTVRVVFINNTGATVNLASGTLRANVWQ